MTHKRSSGSLDLHCETSGETYENQQNDFFFFLASFRGLFFFWLLLVALYAKGYTLGFRGHVKGSRGSTSLGDWVQGVLWKRQACRFRWLRAYLIWKNSCTVASKVVSYHPALAVPARLDGLRQNAAVPQGVNAKSLMFVVPKWRPDAPTRP